MRNFWRFVGKILPGIVLVVSPLWKIIGHASNLQFVLSASGDTRMVAMWNFLTSPNGNLIVVAAGIGWIGVACQKAINKRHASVDLEDKSPTKDETIRQRNEEIDHLREQLGSTQLAPVTLKAKPILEHIGLDVIENVLWRGSPSSGSTTLYAVRIRNAQVDASRTAINAKARIYFTHEEGSFVVDEAPWITSRHDQNPGGLLVWVGDRTDIESADWRHLLIAGMHSQPPQSQQPFLSWAVARDGDTIKAIRWLGFGKWTCTVKVSADMVEPMEISISFNLDKEGRIVNFGSSAATMRSAVEE
jgi:hypothetical protein